MSSEPGATKELLCQLEGAGRVFGRPRDIRALWNVNLSIYAAEFLCVRGPSGSGKSTLLNLVGVLDWPTDGRVRWFGEDVRRLGRRARGEFRRRNIGFMLPELRLVPYLSALENVMLPALFDSETIEPLEAAAREKLSNVGCGLVFGSLPSELSTGERQRVLLARALVREPRLLIADEPTANLDRKNVETVGLLLRGLVNQGRTVLVATHDDRLMEYADRVLRLEDGEVVSDESVVAS